MQTRPDRKVVRRLWAAQSEVLNNLARLKLRDLVERNQNDGEFSELEWIALRNWNRAWVELVRAHGDEGAELKP